MLENSNISYLTQEEIDSMLTKIDGTMNKDFEEKIKNNPDLQAFQKLLEDSYKEKIENIRLMKIKIIRMILNIKKIFPNKTDDEIVEIIINE